MSNAKWRKLFTWLAGHDDVIEGFKIKLLLEDDDILWETRAFGLSDLEATHLADNDLQPIAYMEIEWVDIVTSHADQLLAEIMKVGKFEIRSTDVGLRFYGYTNKAET